MDIQPLLTQLAANVGLDELRLDSDGRCLITFDNHLDVWIVPLDRQSVVLESVLERGRPEDNFGNLDEEYLRVLLQRNLSRLRQQPESLGLNPKTGEIVLFRILEMNPFPDFLEALEQFVNAVETWATVEARATSQAGELLPFSVLRP